MDCILSIVSEGLIYPNNKLPKCKYGSNCYRKNPNHFAEFQHPSTSNIARFSTENLSTYELLRTKLNQIFDLSPFQILSLFYYDDENDKIEVTSTIEWNELISNNPKNQIILFLSIKLQSSYLKTCTNCTKQIPAADKFRFECSTCSQPLQPIIFCQNCENLAIENNLHNPTHKFTKIYYQQDIFSLVQFQPFVPPKLSPFFPPSYYSQIQRFNGPVPSIPSIPQMKPLFSNPPQNNNVDHSKKIQELSDELSAIRKMIADLDLSKNQNNNKPVVEEVKEVPIAIPSAISPTAVQPEVLPKEENLDQQYQILEDQRLVAHLMANKYVEQMDHLLELGFGDLKENLRLLRRNSGNLDKVISILCNNNTSSF